jgi:hypothetical protein
VRYVALARPNSPCQTQALCTLGNGYFATRGCLEEARADADEHYPGTYMARGWNREISKVEGRDVANEAHPHPLSLHSPLLEADGGGEQDLVNLPNWIHITFRPEGQEWFSWNRDSKGTENGGWMVEAPLQSDFISNARLTLSQGTCPLSCCTTTHAWTCTTASSFGNTE